MGGVMTSNGDHGRNGGNTWEMGRTIRPPLLLLRLLLLQLFSTKQKHNNYCHSFYYNHDSWGGVMRQPLLLLWQVAAIQKTAVIIAIISKTVMTLPVKTVFSTNSCIINNHRNSNGRFPWLLFSRLLVVVVILSFHITCICHRITVMMNPFPP